MSNGVSEDITSEQSDRSNVDEESIMTRTSSYDEDVQIEETLPKTGHDDGSVSNDDHPMSNNEEMNHAVIPNELTNGVSEDQFSKTIDRSPTSSADVPMKVSVNSLTVDEELSKRMDDIEADQAEESTSGEKPYKCYICDKLFSRNSSLKCHIRLHLEGPVNILRKGSSRMLGDTIVVDKEDYSADGGQDDVLNTSNEILPNKEGLYECHLCSRAFDRKKGLFRHIGYHNTLLEQAEARVDTIDDAGSDIDLALADESSLDGENGDQFECMLCGKAFKSSRAMKIHSTHAHREMRVNRTLDNENSVENIESEDEIERNFECNYCGRFFHSRRARSIHAVHAHRVGTKFPEVECVITDNPPDTSTDKSLYCFTCSFCRSEFDTARAMNVHIADRHEDCNSFQCVVCLRTYETIKGYNDHARGICGKAQIQNGSYVYGCEECPKTFAHPKSMSRHVREHRLSEQDHLDNLTKALHEAADGHGESVGNNHPGSTNGEQFKCASCSKSYPNVKALAGHMKIHNRPSAESAVITPPKVATISYNGTNTPGEEEVKLYPCHYCDRTFTSNVGYAGHMKVHKDRTSISNSHSENVDENKATAEGEKTFVCRLCDKKFSSGVQLGGHMRHHTAAMKAGVETLDSFHADVDSDDIELNEHDEEYICDTCDETFDCKEDLSEHVQHHASDMGSSSLGKIAEDGGLLCEYCDRPFNGVKSLKTHMYRYHRSVMMKSSQKVEDKVYKCDSCPQKFTYLSEFKKHTTDECRGATIANPLKRSSSDDIFKCDYCDQTFLLRCHLQKHMKSRCHAVDLKSDPLEPGINGDSSNDFVPPSKRIRKSTFMSSMYEYEPLVGSRKCSQQKPVNLRAEFGDKPFECVYCEKCFGKKEDLMKHVRTHAESQDFDDEDFDNYINLHAEEHFVIQNQEGDEEHFIFEQYDDNEGYQCSECDETYRDKLQMIVHMSFHVNSKLPNGGYKSPLIIKADSTLLAPYKCKFCEERFINKSYRSRHLCKCHRNEILQCEICQKLFLHKETLKQHCKQHTIDTKYFCEYCQKCFTSKWFLKRHTRRHCTKRLENLEETVQYAYENKPTTQDLVDEYNFAIEEKIETEQADSEILTDHFIKEEIPKSEVVMHVQMQPV